MDGGCPVRQVLRRYLRRLLGVQPDLRFPEWDGHGWTVYIRWPCGCDYEASGDDVATFDPQRDLPVRCGIHHDEGNDDHEDSAQA